MRDRLKLGATGAYPEGKLDRHDEGELRMAVTRQGDIVRIDFGKPVTWIGMSPDDARGLAALLLKQAGDNKGAN